MRERIWEQVWFYNPMLPRPQWKTNTVIYLWKLFFTGWKDGDKIVLPRPWVHTQYCIDLTGNAILIHRY